MLQRDRDARCTDNFFTDKRVVHSPRWRGTVARADCGRGTVEAWDGIIPANAGGKSQYKLRLVLVKRC